MAVRMLTASGHAVESAPNGSAGLTRLTAVLGSADDFDVVLCDFQMPVRVGCEVSVLNVVNDDSGKTRNSKMLVSCTANL